MRPLLVLAMSILFSINSFAFNFEPYFENLPGEYSISYKKTFFSRPKNIIITLTAERDFILESKLTGKCAGEYSIGFDNESYHMDALVVSPINTLECEGGFWILARLVIPRKINPKNYDKPFKAKIDIYKNGHWQRDNILYKKVTVTKK